MEKAALLPAVERVVGRIEIEHQHLRLARQAAPAEGQERRLHRRRMRVQLAVMIRVLRAQFQAVQSRRARQRRAAMIAATALRAEHIRLARRRRQQRVAPQLRVIIEILVAQRQRVNALREQLPRAVIDELRIAPVQETARQSAGDAQALINLPEQERAAIAAEPAAGKIRDDFARTKFLKKQLPAETLCLASCGVGLLNMWLHTNI